MPTGNFGPGDPARSHQPNERLSPSATPVACTKAIALAFEARRRAAI
jgi:acetylornithine deacetylase